MDTRRSGADQAVAKPRYSIARGFGNLVPLNFAAKQIVPAPLKLVYANGVDPDVSVSWQGGRPWDQVLASMLRSQGLHMTLARGTVTIRN